MPQSHPNSKVIGDYLFTRQIGNGSFGKVKEVRSLRTDVKGAAKIIKDQRLSKVPSGKACVEREIEVLRRLQRLDCTNIVRLIDVFRVDEKKKLYIVTELCVRSLQDLLNEACEGESIKGISEVKVNDYFTQLMDGVDALHSYGIIHKDIKPGNLLLTSAGRLKICDFGTAELVGCTADDDWCYSDLGTALFQPPELAPRPGILRFRGRPVDMWACGVTLFNLLSGHYPFVGENVIELFHVIRTRPLHLPATTKVFANDEGLRDLLHGLLDKDPQRRWDSTDVRRGCWFRKFVECAVSF